MAAFGTGTLGPSASSVRGQARHLCALLPGDLAWASGLFSRSPLDAACGQVCLRGGPVLLDSGGGHLEFDSLEASSSFIYTEYYAAGQRSLETCLKTK